MAKVPDSWNGDGQVARKRATWQSSCAYCDEEIHEGDVIERWGDDWVHLECADTLRQEEVD